MTDNTVVMLPCRDVDCDALDMKDSTVKVARKPQAKQTTKAGL
jgi:hypothetical protein